jgi:AmmeMemoRadiSam system protein B
MIRKPAVAGAFYEADEDSLKRRIEWCFNHELGPGRIPDHLGTERELKGIIVPHAGYMYSGPIAAHAYLNLAEDGLPDTFIILCPNHTGMGSGVSTVSEGQWETPLGLSSIDEEFTEELLQNAAILDSEPLAHLQEHSCEVQLPFLQYIAGLGDKQFKIVPICMWMQDLETASEIGRALAKTSDELERDVVLVASTDFTHYQHQQIASNNDGQVLDAIRSLNETRFINTVGELNVSMCGYGAVAATIVYSKTKGVKKAEIYKYATSGDITGDYSAVVGYASAGLI